VVASFGSGCGPDVLLPADTPAKSVTEWPSYGGDVGGQRYAKELPLTVEDAPDIGIAWTYETGDYLERTDELGSETAFENTPILIENSLYVCTPFNRVIALDPATGTARWSFDPEIPRDRVYANQMVCRGVAAWRDAEAATGAPCATTIFTATNDARLIALDARSGRRCESFAGGGDIDLAKGVGELAWRGEYQVTSPPSVLGNLVIVGAAVSDNIRVDAPSGVVRAFDARTGKPVWAWDLAPPGYTPGPEGVSSEGFALGTPNVWAPTSVDPARDLIFVPTGNAAPDFFRGPRADMSYYGSSIVALRGSTGEVVWHFQTVHRDLWDYDVPSQPALTTIDIEGAPRDVVVQTTKMGFVFVLDRETGESLFPIDERPVPQAGVREEELSPTQPFPLRPPPLVRTHVGPDDAWGVTPWDRGVCRDRLEELYHDGLFSPPTLGGTLMLPGSAGGSNWGGPAIDPERMIAVVRASDLPYVVTLIPREEFAAKRSAAPRVEHGPQLGTPYGVRREVFVSPLGLPCIKPPWGVLSAIDLRSGKLLWQVPHGTVRDLAPVPLPITLGVPGIGGPIVSRGGLVFIAAALDDYLRAYDIRNGDEVWRGRLPAGGQATPMSYSIEFETFTRHFIVIAAGGHSRGHSKLGGSVVAFAFDELHTDK